MSVDPCHMQILNIFLYLSRFVSIAKSTSSLSSLYEYVSHAVYSHIHIDVVSYWYKSWQSKSILFKSRYSRGLSKHYNNNIQITKKYKSRPKKQELEREYRSVQSDHSSFYPILYYTFHKERNKQFTFHSSARCPWTLATRLLEFHSELVVETGDLTWPLCPSGIKIIYW